jgi:hypothetical protein
MTLVSRRELTKKVRDRYWRASKTEKIKILDEFVANTGYHRKYALALLHNRVPQHPSNGRRRKRIYTPDVVDALTFIWKKMRYCGSHRMHPFIPEMLSVLEHHNELHVLPTTRQLLVFVKRKGNHMTAEKGATLAILLAE